MGVHKFKAPHALTFSILLLAAAAKGAAAAIGLSKGD